MSYVSQADYIGDSKPQLSKKGTNVTMVIPEVPQGKKINKGFLQKET